MDSTGHRQALVERLEEVLRIEERVIGALPQADGLTQEGSAAAAAVCAQARSRRSAVRQRLAALAPDEHAAPSADDTEPSPAPGASSAAFRDAATAMTAAAFEYEASYQAARLSYEGETCDLIETLLTDCLTAIGTLRRALPHVVAAELAGRGILCACRCPMCSIGLCGCLRVTSGIAELAWTRHLPRRSRGVALMTDPRPGSDLAQAGLVKGDRVLAVDGALVGRNVDVQEALRRRAVGDEVRLDVRRADGSQLGLAVTRVA